MTNFTADFLANLGGELAANVIAAAGRRAQRELEGPEGYRAFQQCVQAGVVALVATAAGIAPDRTAVLEEVLRAFFRNPDFGDDIATDLFSGRPMNRDKFAEYFEAAGYVAGDFPELDLRSALAAFEVAFAVKARREPALQEIIKTPTRSGAI